MGCQCQLTPGISLKSGLQAAAEDVVPIEEDVSTACEIGLKGTVLDGTLRLAWARVRYYG